MLVYSASYYASRGVAHAYQLGVDAKSAESENGKPTHNLDSNLLRDAAL